MLHVEIHQARGLRETQTIGRQDPFAVASVLPGGSKKRTRCCEGGGTGPLWGLEHRNQLAFPLAEGAETLLIEIWNENWAMHDYIGAVEVELSVLRLRHGDAMLSGCRWYPADTGGELQVTLVCKGLAGNPGAAPAVAPVAAAAASGGGGVNGEGAPLAHSSAASGGAPVADATVADAPAHASTLASAAAAEPRATAQPAGHSALEGGTTGGGGGGSGGGGGLGGGGIGGGGARGVGDGPGAKEGGCVPVLDAAVGAGAEGGSGAGAGGAAAAAPRAASAQAATAALAAPGLPSGAPSRRGGERVGVGGTLAQGANDATKRSIGAAAPAPACAGTLFIDVERARGLPCVQRVGSMDPYVKVTLLPRGTSCETAPAHGGHANPQWGAERAAERQLCFDLEAGAPSSLLLEAWNRNRASRDERIGHATVSISSLAQLAGSRWHALSSGGELLLTFFHVPRQVGRGRAASGSLAGGGALAGAKRQHSVWERLSTVMSPSAHKSSAPVIWNPSSKPDEGRGAAAEEFESSSDDEGGDDDADASATNLMAAFGAAAAAGNAAGGGVPRTATDTNPRSSLWDIVVEAVVGKEDEDGLEDAAGAGGVGSDGVPRRHHALAKRIQSVARGAIARAAHHRRRAREPRPLVVSVVAATGLLAGADPDSAQVAGAWRQHLRIPHSASLALCATALTRALPVLCAVVLSLLKVSSSGNPRQLACLSTRSVGAAQLTWKQDLRVPAASASVQLVFTVLETAGRCRCLVCSGAPFLLPRLRFYALTTRFFASFACGLAQGQASCSLGTLDLHRRSALELPLAKLLYHPLYVPRCSPTDALELRAAKP